MKRRPCLVLGICAALAGCGNGAHTELRRERVVEALVDIVRPEDPPDIAEMRGFEDFALANTTGPLLLVEQPLFDRAAYFVPASGNGEVVTYGSDAQSSLAFRGPVLVASRGLGDDLMSSDVGPLPARLAARSEGSYERVMRYLDGEDRTVSMTYECTLTRGALAMTEYCGSADMEFVNEYSFSEGRFDVATQWHGAANRELVVRFLR